MANAIADERCADDSKWGSKILSGKRFARRSERSCVSGEV